MEFYARSVRECWLMARRVAEAYQHQANKAGRRSLGGHRDKCLAARDAASRIALKIRFGRYRPR